MEELMAYAATFKREKVNAKELIIGMKCGGSRDGRKEGTGKRSRTVRLPSGCSEASEAGPKQSGVPPLRLYGKAEKDRKETGEKPEFGRTASGLPTKRARPGPRGNGGRRGNPARETDDSKRPIYR